MSTFATGDTHGNLVRIKKFIKRFDCTENDTIVILGDVGINYFGQEHERKAKEKYNNFGVTLLCIQGNHEERPYNFPTYKTKIWNGGLVYYEEEFPNLLFAKDGEIYNIDGKKCMPIGGAYSVDKWYRILKTYINYRYAIEDTLDAEEYEKALMFVQGDYPDSDYKIRHRLDKLFKSFPAGICGWFPDEQPSDEIKLFVEEQIKAHEVDIIFSHTCPQKYTPTEMFLSSINQSTVDHSTEDWLDSIEERINYQKWYCGHWHTNKKIDKMIFLFEDFSEV